MAAVSLGTLSDIEKTYYIREALTIAKPALIFKQFGTKERVPAREGKTAQWIRFTKLGLVSTTNYTKNSTGAPPTWTPDTPADTTVTAQLDFLAGNGFQWNEGIGYTSLVDLPKELRIITVQQAAEVMEVETRDVIKAGTNVLYANQKTARNLVTSVDKIDLNDVLDLGVSLRANDAPKIKGVYPVLCSPYTVAQLMKDTTFLSAVQFQKEYLFTGEITKLYGMAFMESSLAPTVSNSGSNNAVATLEQTIALGDMSFGVTTWMLNDFDVIYTPPGGHGDEYAVLNKLAWKMYYKAVILNQSWLARMEAAR
jgi:N4-gp56 family major capsid protein